jgi:hypothetical protein
MGTIGSSDQADFLGFLSARICPAVKYDAVILLFVAVIHKFAAQIG